MEQDRYGLPLSTSSAAAARAYVDGVDRLLAAHEGAEAAFDHALAADPEFALAHLGRARSLQVEGRSAPARAAAAEARVRAAGLGRRERQHVEALALAVAGQGARALALVREHLAEFPRDVMALAAANGVYGLIGFSGRQERNEDLLALLDGVADAYGEDWWFLGAHGFARTEALGWRAGAPLIERSLELAPRNAHAAHAWAHVFYERGDDERGAAFVEGWMPEYPKAAPLHCHLSWHQALFEVGRGRPERALALYEANIRPGRSLGPPFATLVDSASLLWRRELAGAPRLLEEWSAVAQHARAWFPGVGLAFADVHCAVALAAAGDSEGLEGWVRLLHEADAQGRLPAGSVVPIVAEAMGAFAQGRFEDAVAGLAPVMDQLVRVGGSWAQRDLFAHTLLAAYLRTGRLDDARALLRQRVTRQPSVPVVAA
ncbi:MAG TPA: tetratricopeptide repeat protein [Methylomirabilota bacterium]